MSEATQWAGYAERVNTMMFMLQDLMSEMDPSRMAQEPEVGELFEVMMHLKDLSHRIRTKYEKAL